VIGLGACVGTRLVGEEVMSVYSLAVAWEMPNTRARCSGSARAGSAALQAIGPAQLEQRDASR
jgi:hypothetical protein